MPVSPIANSTGKNIINTGVRIVPKPNPEKNVRMATKNATSGINIISIFIPSTDTQDTKSWQSFTI